jgi:hypothetical protein
MKDNCKYRLLIRNRGHPIRVGLPTFVSCPGGEGGEGGEEGRQQLLTVNLKSHIAKYYAVL